MPLQKGKPGFHGFNRDFTWLATHHSLKNLFSSTNAKKKEYDRQLTSRQTLSSHKCQTELDRCECT